MRLDLNLVESNIGSATEVSITFRYGRCWNFKINVFVLCRG